MSLRVRLLFNFPTYKVLAISIVSIIVGVASISLSVVGLFNQIWGHYVGTGIWSGSVIAVTGFFGIASAQTRGVCVVKTFMMFSVFSSLVSLGVIALSVGGLIYNSKFYPDVHFRHPNTRMIHGMLLGTGTLQAVLSVVCAAISIKHICCRPKPKTSSPSSDVGEARPAFRRGNERQSQSSSAPLMSSGSRQKPQNRTHRSSPDRQQSSSSNNHSAIQQSASCTQNPSQVGAHHSRDRSSRQDKRHHKNNSSERSGSDRVHRERNNRTSRGNRSPDRYANKPNSHPEAAAASETSIETDHNLAAVSNLNQITIDVESRSNNIEPIFLDNDMDGLPPYEEVIKDTSLEDNLFSLPTTDLMDVESISLSSHNNLSNRASFSIDQDDTRIKEFAAEQEALLCLSAALETPVTSANSGISNLLSDPLLFTSNLSSLSGSSNLEPDNIRKLSTDLVIHSQNNSNDDEHSTPNLSISERQALFQKYNTSDPDPQGVVYKGFSRNSNVIKERINDGKPKRSKSFQQTREREFARGKSLSSRHLSFDTEDQNNRQIIRNIDDVGTQSERNFRPASKSFSRASSIPGKPPPKPPRTSSLRQTCETTSNKYRPKSATLPYSQFAITKILDDGKCSDTQTKDNDSLNHNIVQELIKDEKTMKERDENSVHKINPPKFRYPRAKLMNTTFQEFKKYPKESSSTSLQKGSTEVQSVLTDGPPLLQPKPNKSMVSDLHVEQPCKRQNSLNSKTERDLTLPLFTLPSLNTDETIQSPLKSPTDYSVVPLKEILMKGGQPSSKSTHRLSKDCVSSSSDDVSSEESSSSVKSAAADNVEGAEVNSGDVDSQNQSDTEGKPMYSFLL